ncbi:hypothetical protein ACTJJ0_03980 [Chitinophaga sp. 22321]|uniref:Uncharacterized protein n=1 Tax=Chitinophaga hostae TaxID=2831022 RepID=A0ABS5IXW1_9BACT|nr:hypothetical protein [Chitinophaga hostae]MBS0027800.1 hypothetical protein [Chitinophaga hostae]
MKRVLFFVTGALVCFLFSFAAKSQSFNNKTNSPGPIVVTVFNNEIPGTYYKTTNVMWSPSGGTAPSLNTFDLDSPNSYVIQEYNGNEQSTTASGISYSYPVNSPVWKQINFTVTGGIYTGVVQVQFGTNHEVSVRVQWSSGQ